MINLVNQPSMKVNTVILDKLITMPFNDLSTIHQLLSDLFHWPTSLEEWKQYELSEEQVEFFRVNGFLSGIRMLDTDQVERIRTEFAKLPIRSIPVMICFMNFIPMNQPILPLYFFMH